MTRATTSSSSSSSPVRQLFSQIVQANNYLCKCASTAVGPRCSRNKIYTIQACTYRIRIRTYYLVGLVELNRAYLTKIQSLQYERAHHLTWIYWSTQGFCLGVTERIGSKITHIFLFWNSLGSKADGAISWMEPVDRCDPPHTYRRASLSICHYLSLL